MKNKKGFTLVEVIVSVALIMVVLFYLLRSIINISDKNTDLTTRQEYSVYENNLLKSFYKDTEDMSTGSEIGMITQNPEEGAISGIYTIVYGDIKDNNEPVKLIINKNNNTLTYHNIVYELPDNVTFSEKNGKPYDIVTIQRQRDDADKYGMIATNIYFNVHGSEEVIELLYQGILETYQVSFYKNESLTDNNVYATVSIIKGMDLTESLLPPTPSHSTGKSFLGWYRDRVSGNSIGKTEKITGDTILYAHWGENGSSVYYVEYRGNGSTSGQMPKQTIEMDKNIKLTKNQFQKSGYVFMGWNTKANGTGKTYSDQATVNNLAGPTGSGKTIQLYAQWQLGTYDVALDKQGGTGGTDKIYEKHGYGFYLDDIATKKMSTKTNKVNVPSKYKYTFGGYYTSIRCSGTQYINENGYLTSDADETYFNSDGTLYACWKDESLPEPDPIIPTGAQTYTVKYNANGGSGNMADSVFERDKDNKLRANSFTKGNSTFIGWNTKANGTGTSYSNKATVKNLASANKSITLYAQWIDEIKYTATFNPNGGSEPNPKTITKPAGDTLGSLPTTSKNENTFDGWYTSSSGGSKINSNTTMPSNNVTYYAHWTPNSNTDTDTDTGTKTYTISYDCMGGSGAPSSQTIKLTNKFTISGYTCQKRGYTQVDWIRDSNGVSWGGVTNYSWDVKSDVQFNAKYDEKTATLSYNANGHGTAPSSVTMKYSAATNAASAISASGWSFQKWCTLSNGGGTCYNAGAQVKGANVEPTATTLYAQWKEDATYTISYDCMGGSGAPSSQTIKLTNKFTISDYTCQKRGYTQVDWIRHSNGVSWGGTKNYPWDVTDNVTFDAKYNANKYTIKYDANGGSGAPSDQTYTYSSNQNDVIVLSSTEPKRTNYDFLGWSLSSTATSASYGKSTNWKRSNVPSSGTSYTLYAVWKSTSGGSSGGGSGGGCNYKYSSSKNPCKTGWTYKRSSCNEYCTIIQNIKKGSYSTLDKAADNFKSTACNNQYSGYCKAASKDAHTPCAATSCDYTFSIQLK